MFEKIKKSTKDKNTDDKEEKISAKESKIYTWFFWKFSQHPSKEECCDNKCNSEGEYMNFIFSAPKGYIWIHTSF